MPRLVHYSYAAAGGGLTAAGPQPRYVGASPSQEANVLYTIALVLLILWLIGALGAYTAGGLLHLLLVAAIVIGLYQLITGRRAP